MGDGCIIVVVDEVVLVVVVVVVEVDVVVEVVVVDVVVAFRGDDGPKKVIAKPIASPPTRNMNITNGFNHFFFVEFLSLDWSFFEYTAYLVTYSS